MRGRRARRDVSGVDGRSSTRAGTASLAQAIPQAGEKLTTDNGTVLEVIEASPRRVRRVRIHPVADADSDEAAESASE